MAAKYTVLCTIYSLTVHRLAFLGQFRHVVAKFWIDSDVSMAGNFFLKLSIWNQK